MKDLERAQRAADFAVRRFRDAQEVRRWTVPVVALVIAAIIIGLQLNLIEQFEGLIEQFEASIEREQ